MINILSEVNQMKYLSYSMDILFSVLLSFSIITILKYRTIFQKIYFPIDLFPELWLCYMFIFLLRKNTPQGHKYINLFFLGIIFLFISTNFLTLLSTIALYLLIFCGFYMLYTVLFGIISLFLRLGYLKILSFNENLCIKHSSNLFYNHCRIFEGMDAFLFSKPAYIYTENIGI